MAMAKMILDDISIESNGDVSTTGYILPYAISMEKLFEVYVRAYFKKNGMPIWALYLQIRRLLQIQINSVGS